ncbi:hypothetical protein [Photorhabdus hainanensis]|uniref:hypothetical protein n=1 Tax=Photorhabdus hainanensis TaxID=1004166 RepID=UPI001BD5F6AF|nr:hypothetical protein [Photorhabdus hainanensis]
MKSPGRGKALSGRPLVGIRSASGRVKNISAKSDTARLHSKAVGLSKNYCSGRTG